MTDFHVGQLVLCVDDQDHGWVSPLRVSNGNMANLRKGQVYTVREACLGWNSCQALKLEEIIRLICRVEDGEIPFAAVRFRPLRDDAIDVFREMLEPTQHERKIAAAVRELINDR